MRRLRRYASYFLVAAFLTACASQSIKPYASHMAGERTIPRHVIVTAAHFQPEAKIDLLLRSKSELAAAGAGEGALTGAGGAFQLAGGCHDPFCMAGVLLLLPVFTGVGAITGALRNAPTAAPAETIATGEQAMREGIAKIDLQHSVQRAVATKVRDLRVAANVVEEGTVGPSAPEERLTYETVSPQTREAILETSVLRFQFKKFPRQGKKLPYQLVMNTRIRLLAPMSREVLDEMRYVHESTPHTATEWLSDEARLFKATLQEAIDNTATSAVHEMFLIYYPEIPAARAEADKSVVPEYVLRPVFPLPVLGLDLRGMFSKKYQTTTGVPLHFVPVGDLQPTLQWEAFPRPVDVAGMRGQPTRFADVRYELMIYSDRSTVAYTRAGLTEPSHRLEIPLEPCGRYVWTVRAHFTLDGWPRVTDWMGAYDAFPSIKPWEFRRGLNTGPISSLPPGPRFRFLPFRAPSADGKECD